MTQLHFAREKLWTKDYVVLTLSNFLMFVSLQMLIPTLPVYVQEMGASNFVIGLTVSFFAASALVARPFTGIMLDRIGRKIVLFAGLILLVMTSLQYFWITSVFLILFLRILHGLSWGVATTGMGTVVADIVPASRRGEGLGYFGLSVTFSLATAPYFGLWVMETFGFTWMFVVSSAAAALSLILARSASFRFQPGKRSVESKIKRHWVLQIFEKKALLPSLLAFLFMSAYSSVEVFIALFAEEKNIPSAGAFFVVLAAAMFLIRPLAGKLFDRFGFSRIILPGVVVMILGILLLSFSRSLPLLLVSGALCGAGMSAVMPSLQAWNVDRAPSDRIGAANGTYFSGIDLGFSVGSTINSVVAGWTSFTFMYRFINLYLVLFLLVFVIYMWRANRGRT